MAEILDRSSAEAFDMGDPKSKTPTKENIAIKDGKKSSRFLLSELFIPWP